MTGEAQSQHSDVPNALAMEVTEMNTQLTTKTDRPRIIPIDADKHTRCRLGQFEQWLNAQYLAWYSPNLARYRDNLLADGKAPLAVLAHLSTIRARYAAILQDNATRDALYILAGERLPEMRQSDTVVNRVPSEWLFPKANGKAFVDEMGTRIRNAIHPKESHVTVKTSQDKADSEYLRPTFAQASVLMASPGVESLAMSNENESPFNRMPLRRSPNDSAPARCRPPQHTATLASG